MGDEAKENLRLMLEFAKRGQVSHIEAMLAENVPIDGVDHLGWTGTSSLKDAFTSWKIFFIHFRVCPFYLSIYLYTFFICAQNWHAWGWFRSATLGRERWPHRGCW